jgi:hypothetical protein
LIALNQTPDITADMVQRKLIIFEAKVMALKSGHDGAVYASLPDLCIALGLDLDQQEALIEKRADLLRGRRDFMLWVAVRAPGLRLTPCLRADLISSWLACVARDASNRAAIELFQHRAGTEIQGVFDPKWTATDDVMVVDSISLAETRTPSMIRAEGLRNQILSELRSDSDKEA